MKYLIGALVIVSIAACGGGVQDHTASFVGTWRGTLHTTDAVGPQDFPNQQFVITQGAARNDVAFNGTCGITGTADSDTHITIHPISCPPVTTSGCTSADRYDSGSFAREGANARWIAAGTYTIAGPSSCSPGTYSFSETTDLLIRQ